MKRSAFESSKNKSSGKDKGNMSRGRFLQSASVLVASGAFLNMAGCRQPTKEQNHENKDTVSTGVSGAASMSSPTIKPVRVAADPTKIPPPVNWNRPKTHQIHLIAEEAIGEIEEGVLFRYMTFDGQVPAPMFRVRQGDTIDLTLTGDKDNQNPHNVDFHSCYGTGGGAAYLNVGPGQSKSVKFKVLDPGAFIYHCAVANLDYHISCGMFGLILVEPEKGMPKVDREFYLGQHEIYAIKPADANTLAKFDFDNLLKETPEYVVLNGAFNSFTPQRYGNLKAKQGETVRIYFVNGGPNLISSFHPIGNIWSKFWLQGSLANAPFRSMQTVQVNPGSCAILEMKLPIPETIHLADHSITRTAQQGLLANIEVSGTPVPDIFDHSD